MDCLIVADMEGIAGITREEQFRWMTPDWTESRQLVTNEVLAILQGLDKSSIVENVVVRDVHDRGYNILPQMLNAKQFRSIKTVSYIGGQGPSTPVMIGDVGSVDVAILTGMHARSGSEAFEPWAHTFTRSFAKVLINGEMVGESQIFASLINESFHIPTAMITGTSRAIEEVAGFLPRAKLVANPVIYFQPHSARSLGQLARQYEFIEEQAIAAIYEAQYLVFPPNFWSPPIAVELEFKSADVANKIFRMWSKNADISLVNLRSICFTVDTINEALAVVLTLGHLTPFSKKMLRMAPLARLLWRRQSRSHAPEPFPVSDISNRRLPSVGGDD